MNTGQLTVAVYLELASLLQPARTLIVNKSDFVAPLQPVELQVGRGKDRWAKERMAIFPSRTSYR